MLLRRRKEFSKEIELMAIRVTSGVENDSTVIRVEGRLDERSLPYFLRECRKEAFQLKLDLSGLLSLDSEGVQALRDLIRHGAKVSGASSYIRQLLSDGQETVWKSGLNDGSGE